MSSWRPKILCHDKVAARRLEEELVSGLEGDGLEAVFAALAASECFVSHFYGEVPFVLRCGELLAELWSFEEQLQLLRHTSYEVFDGEGREPIELKGYSRFTHSAIGEAELHSFMAAGDPAQPGEAAVRRGLETGTWVLSSGNSLSPKLAQLCEAVQRGFRVPFVTTNVYISRLDAAVTAPLHTDRFDSFILQTEGAKRWRVFGTSDEVPKWPVLDASMSDRGKAGDVLYVQQVGALLLDECLRAGDVLYLPRGFPHATSTFDTSSQSSASYSTSLTVSLLLESVGLTVDKVLRCAAGMYEGRNARGQCFGAEEVLRCTPSCPSLRATLPIGFLSPNVGEDEWVEAMSRRVEGLVESCGLARWREQGEALEAVLRRVLRHVWRALPVAAAWCRERVYATGSVLKKLEPDARHEVEEKALVEFPFFPEEGLIYVRSPSISAAPLL